MANAGHIPPYRHGEELQVDSGLPLGIVADVEYSEIEFHLKPGDTLTLISDGVVEAMNADGELYGFERTRHISTQPANIIAAAAQAFGQEDDITVLKLHFSAAEVSPRIRPAEHDSTQLSQTTGKSRSLPICCAGRRDENGPGGVFGPLFIADISAAIIVPRENSEKQV